MKSIYKITTFLIISIFTFGIVVANAQETSPTTTPPPVKPNIRANIENRVDKNRDVRNNLLEKKEIKKEMRSDIKEMRMEIKDTRKDAREEMKEIRASSTNMFKKNNEVRKDMVKKMESRTFEIRKNALLKELNFSISNLSNISTRIETRITKAESEGRTMTEARALLITAKEKLEKAKADVASFQALTTNASTTEVELTKPRVLGDTAIKSVKEARDSFQKVVVSIAHAMGMKEAKESVATPSVSASPETN
jgi:hypothetical protein